MACGCWRGLSQPGAPSGALPHPAPAPHGPHSHRTWAERCPPRPLPAVPGTPAGSLGCTSRLMHTWGAPSLGTKGPEKGSVHLSVRGRGPPSTSLETCFTDTAVPEVGRGWPLPTALLCWPGATAAYPGQAGSCRSPGTEHAGQGPPAGPQWSPTPHSGPRPPPVPVTPCRAPPPPRWVDINHRGRVSSI